MNTPFHDAAFRRRRAGNWLLAGLMYAVFYMARYNFAAVNARLAELFGWSNLQIGVVSSTATLVYGLAVFLNGPLADRIGGRRAILIGAAGAAGFNVLFGALHLFLDRAAVWKGDGAAHHLVLQAQLRAGMTTSTLLALFATVWACNHYFQSFGALSIVKINAAWFHVRERGFFSGIFGILIRLGLVLAFSGSPLILRLLPWQWVFWVPATLLLLLFLGNFLFVRDTPAEAGLAAFDTGDESPGQQAEKATLGAVLRKVFGNRITWSIAACSMMIGFVRRSVVDDWWPKYFVNVHHADARGLASFAPYEVAAWGIALAGILGGLVFGYLSDHLFDGRRAPVVVAGFCGMVLVLSGFALGDRAGGGPFAAAIWLIALSFFVNGAHGMIGGAASMDFGGRQAAATAAGLFDGMQYIAGSVVGVSVGRLLDRFGWGVWPLFPIPFAIVGAALMSSLWNARPGRMPAGPPADVEAAA
ncbi:MAG: MFS transporter [Myxococcales bacterium]